MGPENDKNDVLSAAIKYVARGYSPIPVPHREKKPVLGQWEQLRLTAETAHQYFSGGLQNIGVLLGEPSDWLVDVDLDHLMCLELAPEFLPRTAAIFGRTGKPKSHWVYRVSGPVATKQLTTKSTGMLVELRSTGAQTIFPPSTHVSGDGFLELQQRFLQLHACCRPEESSPHAPTVPSLFERSFQ